MSGNFLDLPIGEAIYKTRVSLSLTREEITLRTGIHRNTICRLEKGLRPASLQVLIKISRAMDVDLSRIIKRAESLRPAP